MPHTLENAKRIALLRYSILKEKTLMRWLELIMQPKEYFSTRVLFATLLTAFLLCSQTSLALDLAYSFEADAQGFAGNGPGVTVTQDTIGATEGTQSLKVDIVQGATFVGALTDQLDPFIANPPGLDFILYDLTITEQFPQDEGFVDAGVTIFGVSQPDFPGGQLDLQVQFFDEQVSLGDLEVGTHEIRMNLTDATHPLTFETEKGFNDIFGIDGGGANDVVPTGFQIYINKSSNAPWTGYIDNIRVGSLPGPNGGDYNGDGFVDAADYTVWRDNLDGSGPDGDGTTTGDLLGIPDGVVDAFDYDYWVQEYGSTIVSSSAATSVPEPSSFIMLLASLVSTIVVRSKR